MSTWPSGISGEEREGGGKRHVDEEGAEKQIKGSSGPNIRGGSRRGRRRDSPKVEME